MRAQTQDVQTALDKLSEGQTVTYKLPETFGSEFAHIQRNPEGKGKKYTLTLEKTEASKPTGKKTVFMEHNSSRFVANWVHQF
ncbi:MAG: hypothetical protein V1894_07375, partial [Chloroflexota bacterium]